MNKTYPLSQIVQNVQTIQDEYFDEILRIGGKRSILSEYFKFQRIGVHVYSILEFWWVMIKATSSHLFFQLIFVFVTGGIFSSPGYTQSSQHDQYDRLFEERFFSHYMVNHCAQNILEFGRAAFKNNLSYERAYVLVIQNHRHSLFGLINAEKVRNNGAKLDTPLPHGIRFAPGERNWEYHVVLFVDGKIYDFDFLNSPTPLSVDDYIEEMFLNDNPNPPKWFGVYIGREVKASEYKVSLFLLKDLLKESHLPPTKTAKRTYLFKDFLREFRDINL